MSPTLQEVVIRTGTLVSLPEVCIRVRDLVLDPDASLGDIATALTSDPALAARVLKLANCAFFGVTHWIDTVPGALSVLGTQKVHDLVLSSSMMRMFRGIPRDLIDMRSCWRASLVRGCAAKLVAEHLGILDSERLFVAGLLAEIGTLALCLQHGDTMRETLVRHAATGLAMDELLREAFGFDQAELGGALLAAWQLPTALSEPVRWHLHPELDDSDADATWIVHAATCLADARAWPSLSARALQRLDLAAIDAERLRAESGEQAVALAELFLPAAA